MLSYQSRIGRELQDILLPLVLSLPGLCQPRAGHGVESPPASLAHEPLPSIRNPVLLEKRAAAVRAADERDEGDLRPSSASPMHKKSPFRGIQETGSEGLLLHNSSACLLNPGYVARKLYHLWTIIVIQHTISGNIFS